MDLEIRTGLLESWKLNTLIEVTVPRDTLLLGWGGEGGRCGHWRFFPDLPTPSVLQPSAVIAYLTRWAVNSWEKDPTWPNPCPSIPLSPNHALSPLKMCPELGTLKEGLIKGNGKSTP